MELFPFFSRIPGRAIGHLGRALGALAAEIPGRIGVPSRGGRNRPWGTGKHEEREDEPRWAIHVPPRRREGRSGVNNCSGPKLLTAVQSAVASGAERHMTDAGDCTTCQSIEREMQAMMQSLRKSPA